LDFCVLVLDGALPSSVAVTRDMLATATALSSRLGVRAPSWALYSIDGGDVRLGAELKVASKRLPVRSRRDRSLWIIPGLGVADPGAVMARLERADARAAAKRIGAHLRRGGRVAASCASVFLLNAAGVLAGRRATTSWWLAPALTRSASGCLINADQIVCDDGAVITAGAAFAHCDLMLHVLRQFGGDRLADAVSRVLLIESRHAQAPFVIPELLVNGSELVARLAARIEASLPEAKRCRSQDSHASSVYLSARWRATCNGPPAAALAA
jgi:transcriptional regulator GlxA family with amidase domain